MFSYENYSRPVQDAYDDVVSNSLSLLRNMTLDERVNRMQESASNKMVRYLLHCSTIYEEIDILTVCLLFHVNRKLLGKRKEGLHSLSSLEITLKKFPPLISSTMAIASSRSSFVSFYSGICLYLGS